MLILLVVLLGSANCFYVLFHAVPSGTNQLFTERDRFMDTFFKTFQVRRAACPVVLLGLVGEKGAVTRAPVAPSSQLSHSAAMHL